MASLNNKDGIDAGISYQASTPNLRKLLDKVQARKKAVGEGLPGRNDSLMTYRAMLSSKLNDLIQFDIKNLLSRKALGEISSHALYGGLGFGKVGTGAVAGTTLLAGIRGYNKPDPNDPDKKQGIGGAVKGALSWKTAGTAAGAGALLAGGLAARRHLSAKIDGIIQFADPRPRNQMGEFAPQQEEGPDPNAMVKTYRVAPMQPNMAPNKSNLLGLGGLALVGGAAGTVGSEGVKAAGRGFHSLAKKLGYMK